MSRFIKIFVFTVCLLVAAAAALPAILSTSWGNTQLEKIINSRISGSLTLKKLNINWLGSQTAKQVQLFDAENHLIASLQTLSTQMPLWKLILGERGTLELSGFNAKISQYSDGKTNIQYALSAKNSPQPLLTERPLTIDLENMQASISMEDPLIKTLHISGHTVQGQQQGSFDIQLSMNELQGISNLLDKMHLQANFNNFPTNLLDEAAALSDSRYKGLLLALLGDNINLDLEQKGSHLIFTIDTPWIQGSLKAILEDNHLVIDNQNLMTIALQPQFVDLFQKRFAPSSQIHLKDPIKTNIHLQFSGKIEDSNKLTLTAPASIRTTITPSMLSQLGFNQFRLNDSAQIYLQVEPDANGIDFSTLSAMKLKGRLEIDKLDLYGSAAGLDELFIPWEINAPANTLSFQAKGRSKLSNGRSEGSLETQLTISQWLEDGQPDFSRSHIENQLKLVNFPVAFIENINKQLHLTNLIGQSIDVDSHAKISPFNKMSGTIELSVKNPYLEGQGTFDIKNIVNAAGKFHPENMTLLLDAQVQKFPVSLLKVFSHKIDKINERVAVILGDSIQANLQVHINHFQGPIVAHLNGNNGSISLDATLKNDILTLNKDFHTQIQMTPEFGKFILEDIFPLASGLVGSDNPLTINIQAKDFALPIKNFNLQRVNIGSATMELGKVRFKQSGQFGSIANLFNTTKSDLISVWFTPLFVSMHNGMINFQRMDMLVMNEYPIATWGTVDFARDRVNMMIGLTKKALFSGFNIHGLTGNYMLQIPFKGTIANASIDKKMATAKIAAMIASNRGPEGLLIGTALQIASGSMLEEKAPSPTVNPLPWSIDSPESSQQKKTSDHPLHQVEEKATSLLKSLLPF